MSNTRCQFSSCEPTVLPGQNSASGSPLRGCARRYIRSSALNDEFWDCVQNNLLPNRGGEVVESNPKALPLHLLSELIDRVGMKAEDAIELSLEQALERLNKYWTDAAGANDDQ